MMILAAFWFHVESCRGARARFDDEKLAGAAKIPRSKKKRKQLFHIAEKLFFLPLQIFFLSLFVGTPKIRSKTRKSPPHTRRNVKSIAEAIKDYKCRLSLPYLTEPRVGLCQKNVYCLELKFCGHENSSILANHFDVALSNFSFPSEKSFAVHGDSSAHFSSASRAPFDLILIFILNFRSAIFHSQQWEITRQKRAHLDISTFSRVKCVDYEVNGLTWQLE